MDLILWRHAEALEMREIQDDLDRALTSKGERQAHRVAAWLNQRTAVSGSFSRSDSDAIRAARGTKSTSFEVSPPYWISACRAGSRWLCRSAVEA